MRLEIYENEDREWTNSKGYLHRENGPAFEENNGDKLWYVNGKAHRSDGPAIEYINGYKAWWVNGKRHRLDGPAVERRNGNKEWWIEGIQYTEIEYKKEVLKWD